MNYASLSTRFLSAAAGIVLAAAGGVLPARADSADAYCAYSPHDHTMKVVKGPCTFQQYQGSIHVGMDGKWFHFPANDRDITYRRTNRHEGIWLHREGDYTLTVLWDKPAHEPGGY